MRREAKEPSSPPPKDVPATPARPPESVPAEAKPEAKILSDSENFVARAANLPDQPRKGEQNLILPGVGEVSGFTEAAGKPRQNDDTFAVGGNGVLVVADGVFASPQGDLASVDAAAEIVNQTKAGKDLGQAFLAADRKIREAEYDGETVASAVQVHPNGMVDAAIAGDVEIWLLLRKPGGNLKAIPYAIFEGEAPNAALGGKNVPEVVGHGEPGGKNQIWTGRLQEIKPDGSHGGDPLVLGEGEGVLLMVDGVARYYQRHPSQLEAAIQGQSTADGVRRAIQADVAARREVIGWREELKDKWGSSIRWRAKVKIPDGLPFAGNYMNRRGLVYDAPTHEANIIGYVGEKDNQTALVFLRRGPESSGRLPLPHPEPIGSDVEGPPKRTETKERWVLMPIESFPVSRGDLDHLQGLEMRDYVRKILEHEKLKPTTKVTSGEFTHHMGPVIRETTPTGEVYLNVISLVPVQESGKTVLKRRWFYRSQSGGRWRGSPYKIGRLAIKGIGRHYTAETQPTPEIAQHLKWIEKNTKAPLEMTSAELDQFLNLFSPIISAEGKKTMAGGFQKEIVFPPIRGLTELGKHRPGQIGLGNQVVIKRKFYPFHEVLKDVVSQLKDLPYPPDFLPDFRSKPLREIDDYHSLLGPVKLREFGGSFLTEKSGAQRRREVIWTMAEDGVGRVWIESIRFADAKPNSYGVYSEVIDSGVLTSKPLEYNEQSYGIPLEYRLPFDAVYDDITPILDVLLPIKQYREARGVSTPRVEKTARPKDAANPWEGRGKVLAPPIAPRIEPAPAETHLGFRPVGPDGKDVEGRVYVLHQQEYQFLQGIYEKEGKEAPPYLSEQNVPEVLGLIHKHRPFDGKRFVALPGEMELAARLMQHFPEFIKADPIP